MIFSRRKGRVLGISGFTLWEILMIVVVISVGLMSIISLLAYGINYVQKSRQKIVAINLAREGMEAMYQIRDTNRQRWAGRKDECWLKDNPLVDTGNIGCDDDPWIVSGAYVLDTAMSSGQRYFLLTGYTSLDINIADGVDTGDLQYSLCLSGSQWSACPGIVSLTPEGRYFRAIRSYGLFLKDVSVTGGQAIVCTSGTSAPCGSSIAKELRFCSTVVYLGYGTGEVQLCGVMTNFVAK